MLAGVTILVPNDGAWLSFFFNNGQLVGHLPPVAFGAPRASPHPASPPRLPLVPLHLSAPWDEGGRRLAEALAFAASKKE